MTVDPVAMIFYGVVCGGLAAFAPSLGGRAMRAAIGAVVGFAAASVLAGVKGMMGY